MARKLKRNNKVNRVIFAIVVVSVIVLLVGLFGAKITGSAVNINRISTEKDDFYLLIDEGVSGITVETSMISAFIITTEDGCISYANTKELGEYPVYGEKKQSKAYSHNLGQQGTLCMIISKIDKGTNIITFTFR